jgi:hypothetical protein
MDARMVVRSNIHDEKHTITLNTHYNNNKSHANNTYNNKSHLVCFISSCRLVLSLACTCSCVACRFVSCNQRQSEG